MLAEPMHLLFAAASAFLIAAFATWYFTDPRAWLNALDHPNERSLHNIPVPRSGGLAIVLAVLLTGLAVGIFGLLDVYMIWIGVGIIAVAYISFLDDRATVHPLLRLVVHVIVGGALVYAGLLIPSLELPFMSWDWSEPIAVIISLLLSSG